MFMRPSAMSSRSRANRWPSFGEHTLRRRQPLALRSRLSYESRIGASVPSRHPSGGLRRVRSQGFAKRLRHGRGQQLAILPPHAGDLLFAARQQLIAPPVLEVQCQPALRQSAQSHAQQDLIEGAHLPQVFAGTKQSHQREIRFQPPIAAPARVRAKTFPGNGPASGYGSRNTRCPPDWYPQSQPRAGIRRRASTFDHYRECQIVCNIFNGCPVSGDAVESCPQFDPAIRVAAEE